MKIASYSGGADERLELLLQVANEQEPPMVNTPYLGSAETTVVYHSCRGSGFGFLPKCLFHRMLCAIHDMIGILDIRPFLLSLASRRSKIRLQRRLLLVVAHSCTHLIAGTRTSYSRSARRKCPIFLPQLSFVWNAPLITDASQLLMRLEGAEPPYINLSLDLCNS